MDTPTIVAIGGGDLANGETEKIDRFLIALTGKNSLKVLFIPTASQDNLSQITNFMQKYQKYGAKTDYLAFTRGHISFSTVREQIDAADLIYVGGGNTLLLYNYIVSNGYDDLLRTAWQSGTILAGLSAGANIWHIKGIADELSSGFVEMGGLGFINHLVTPHYSPRVKSRKIRFHQLICDRGYRGLAIDDNCAVVYKDKHIDQVISLGPEYGAYWVEPDPTKRNQVKIIPLEKTLIDNRVENKTFKIIRMLLKQPKSLRHPFKI